jgi:hypothetical protein
MFVEFHSPSRRHSGQPCAKIRVTRAHAHRVTQEGAVELPRCTTLLLSHNNNNDDDATVVSWALGARGGSDESTVCLAKDCVL